MEELHIALMPVANYKCSGLDGLSPEFYKSLWGKLKQPRDILEMYESAEKRNLLKKSESQGILYQY